jgi:hypothetical protein
MKGLKFRIEKVSSPVLKQEFDSKISECGGCGYDAFMIYEVEAQGHVHFQCANSACGASYCNAGKCFEPVAGTLDRMLNANWKEIYNRYLEEIPPRSELDEYSEAEMQRLVSWLSSHFLPPDPRDD